MFKFCYIFITVPSIFLWASFLMGPHGWGPSEKSGWAVGYPEEDKGSMKYPTSAPVVLMLEKSVLHYGVWKQEIKNSMKSYPQTLGKNKQTPKKHFLKPFFLLIYQEALGKGCPEGDGRHFLTLWLASLFWDVSYPSEYLTSYIIHESLAMY